MPVLVVQGSWRRIGIRLFCEQAVFRTASVVGFDRAQLSFMKVRFLMFREVICLCWVCYSWRLEGEFSCRVVDLSYLEVCYDSFWATEIDGFVFVEIAVDAKVGYVRTSGGWGAFYWETFIFFGAVLLVVYAACYWRIALLYMMAKCVAVSADWVGPVVVIVVELTCFIQDYNLKGA